MAEHSIKRCAIYTRKSSEEGLEQDYNSLHAQRDACEAFIKSQSGEGWRLIKAPYDDGGFSGGTMERPALRQLLAGIRQGLVDVVVVYKVDRLTRSLADFARMIELFDAHGVSFVAVTQQFNTTTSIGRLTLNVLLSFAQFEREVIGERIRDKVAASKRKGIWTGGSVPLGYEVRERRLLINSEEAPIVRQIFERYLELGTVRKVMRDLSARRIASAIRVSKTGNRRGGKSFGRGALYHLLSNPVYVGEIRHKDERHPGQHEALISRELWERVQIQLRSKPGRKSETRETEAPRSPLTARLFDENGEPLYVQGCAKGRQRYRYYVSKALVRGDGNSNENGWRLSAAEIEQTVASVAVALLSDQNVIVTAAEHSNIDQGRLSSVLKYVRALIERLQSAGQSDSVLREMVERVQLSATAIRLSLAIRLPEQGGPATDTISLTKDFPMQIKRRGVEMRMVLAGESGAVRFDRSLLRAVGRARRWSQQLLSGQCPSIGSIARRERIAPRYIRDLMPLAFLSPKIVKAIVEGRQPAELSIISLARRIDVPLLWTEQQQALGLGDSIRCEPTDFAEKSSAGTS
jgi:DNA invertase Pin-like site-specific DNA recombinase